MRRRHRVRVISLLAVYAAVGAGTAARAQDQPRPAPQRRVSPEGRALLTRWSEALHLPQWTPAATLEAFAFGRRHVMFGREPFMAELRWTRERGLVVEARVPWALAEGLPPQAMAAARRGFSQWTRELLAPVIESPLRRAADYHVEVASEDGTRVVVLTPWAPAAEYESVRFYFLEESGLCERSVAVRRVDPDSPAARLTAGAEILTSFLYRASGVRNLLTETRTVTPSGETVVQYGYDGETPQPVQVTVSSAATGSPIHLTVRRWTVDGKPFTQGVDELIEKLRERRQPTPSIRGRVTLPDGAPAARAAVRVFEPPPPAPATASAPHEDLDLIAHVIYVDPRDWARPRPLAEWTAAPRGGTAPRSAHEVAAGTADADGRFEIAVSGVSGESFIVKARAAGGTATVFDTYGGEVLDIVVGPLMRAPGRLRDPGGKPVSNATIALSDGVEDWTTTTDDAGTFAIDGVAPGRYALRARADGYTPLLQARVLVRADSELDVRLPRGTTLTVTAVLETDAGSEQPLAGVDVVALEADRLVYVRGRTGKNGTCTFNGLPPGNYVVNGRSAVAASFSEDVADLDGAASAQELVLIFEPFVGTPVTVEDAAGRPVEGMVFYCANADEEYDAELSRRLPGATDAAGRFTFAFEFEGPHALIYGRREGLGLVRVVPDAHDTAEPLTVRAGPAMRVFGTVRRPDGRPQPGARVLLEANAGTGEDELLIALRCGPDGSFEYAFTPRGEVWVSAELGDDAWSDDYTVTPLPGQDDYRVEIEIADWR